MCKAYSNTNSPPNSLPSTNQLCPAKRTQDIVELSITLVGWPNTNILLLIIADSSRLLDSLEFMQELSKSATNVQALLQYQFTSKLSSFNNQLCPAKANQGIVDFDFPLAERSVSFFA